MADPSAGSLRARLAVLAVGFVLPGPGGPDVKQAIALACDLLAQGLDTSATTAVACLPWDATLGNSGPIIRGMLDEQGFPVPGAGRSSAEELAFVLRAVAARGLPVGEFHSYFMCRVPAWEQQDELQRRLVLLLNDWDQETTPAGTAAAAAVVRELAREAASQYADRADVTSVVDQHI